MGFTLKTHAEEFCHAQGSGSMFAKKGAMVAQVGQIKYSKRLLGTNKGNMAGQVMNHLARKITGENLEMMECKGTGEIYFADQSAHVTIVTLEPNGAWNHICVESEDLLAFTSNTHYGVTPIGVGVISQKGLVTSKIKYQGNGAELCQVAIKTNGNPLVLQAPCRVDPDAVVAWTGKNPKVKVDVNLKTLIGQTSGESYAFEFNEPGQYVIVQPYERESGLNVAMDGNHKPQMQSSSGQNSMDNMRNMANKAKGSGLGGLIGDAFKNNF